MFQAATAAKKKTIQYNLVQLVDQRESWGRDARERRIPPFTRLSHDGLSEINSEMTYHSTGVIESNSCLF